VLKRIKDRRCVDLESKLNQHFYVKRKLNYFMHHSIFQVGQISVLASFQFIRFFF